jgi:hypothetical protein
MPQVTELLITLRVFHLNVCNRSLTLSRAAGDQSRQLEDLRSNRAVTPAFVLGPADCHHLLQRKREASFRWDDDENWELITTDRPPLQDSEENLPPEIA